MLWRRVSGLVCFLGLEELAVAVTVKVMDVKLCYLDTDELHDLCRFDVVRWMGRGLMEAAEQLEVMDMPAVLFLCWCIVFIYNCIQESLVWHASNEVYKPQQSKRLQKGL